MAKEKRRGKGEGSIAKETTIVNGNCGLSVVPLDCNYKDEVKNYLFPVTGRVDDAMSRYNGDPR